MRFRKDVTEEMLQAARVEGLREAFGIFTTSGHADAVETVQNRIAALERGKENKNA